MEKSNALIKPQTSLERLKGSASRALESAKEKTSNVVEDNIIVEKIRAWVASLFVKAVESCSTEEDRAELLAWLSLTRIDLASDQSTAEKFRAVSSRIDGKKAALALGRSVGEAFNNYKNSNLPLPVKIAIPVTLAASTVIGGAGVGIVGFGTGIGVSALLLVFLGAAGVTSVIDAVLTNKGAGEYVAFIGAMIAHDEILRRTKADLRKAMTEKPAPPHRYDVPEEQVALQQALLQLKPYEFEQHVMSFFQSAGFTAWVTKQSNDAGVDGFARHPEGLIVVQCKRNAPENTVGRPIVQQFKGVIEENEAHRGYIVTTSTFTSEARESAARNGKLVLVDMAVLADWHKIGLREAL